MKTTQITHDIQSEPNQISFVLTFESNEIFVAKRGLYTAITISKGAPYGEAGEPALPWRKFLVFIPNDAQVEKVSCEIVKTTLLASDVLVEPIQPNVPISLNDPVSSVEKVKPIGPNPEVYENPKIWPENPVHFIVVRRLAGKQLAELEVCPFQYHPIERKLDLAQEIAVKVEFRQTTKALLKPQSEIDLRFEQRTLERVKQLVVNPEHVTSLVQLEVAPLDRVTYPNVPYVIITSQTLSNSFQKLADWRTIFGLNARVVTVEDIRANAVADTDQAKFWLASGYSDGGTRDLAEAIRNFIKWANVHWQTEFVLLGGDTNIIPARMAFMPLDNMNYGNINNPDTSRNLIRNVSASSSASGSDPKNVNDTDASTFWSCASTDSTPWISAGVGSSTLPVNHVQLMWGTTAATSYKVQVSGDSTTWADVYSTTTGAGGTVEISFNCTSAKFVRLLIQSGTNFKLHTMKVFGPNNYNTAYTITPTCTRVYLQSWIQPNPTNSSEGDQLLIIDGLKKGTVVPYNPGSNDTTEGWHFVNDLVKVPSTVTAGYTSFLEICGPAAFHGSTFCAKTSLNYIPTDLYYSDLDSPSVTQHDWDADNNRVYGERYGNQIDGVNGIADVHVGRFAVTTPQQADLMVNKVIYYERYRDASPFEALLPSSFAISALLAAQNWYDPGPGLLDGSAACNEEIRHMLVASGTAWRFTRLYEDKADVPVADVTPDLKDANKDGIKAAIAAGNNVVSLVSHGSPGYVCYLVQSDVDNEVNTPSIWYANACTTNKFDDNTISETATLNSQGGAVAYVGNSRYGWTSDGPMERAFWEEMLSSGLLSFMLESAHQIGGDWQKYSLNLIGDPAMRVWSAPPKLISVTHASEIYTGPQRPFLVAVKVDGVPVTAAKVCASIKGRFCITAVTDATGTASLQINPSSVGTMLVTVSGKNLLPYIVNVPVKVGEPKITVTPINIGFGTTRVGSVKTEKLTLSNTGTSVLSVSILSSPPDSCFHWKALNRVEILPGGSLDHEITFAPTKAGVFNESLSVDSNTPDSPHNVGISGTGSGSPPECVDGDEQYSRCWINGRPGYRRSVCINGKWKTGPCVPGEIP